MVEATEKALAAGIAAVRPGNTLATSGMRSPRLPGAPGAACWPTTAASRPHHARGSARAQRRLTWQGHAATSRPGHRNRANVPSQAGALIADGTDDYTHDPDGWTLRIVSGARAAHSEHRGHR